MRISKRLVAKAPKRGPFEYQIESMRLFKKAALNFGRSITPLFQQATETLAQITPSIQTLYDEVQKAKDHTAPGNHSDYCADIPQ